MRTTAILDRLSTLRGADLVWMPLTVALLGLSWRELHRIVFILLALYGVYQLIRHGREAWADPPVRRLTLLFACLWLPMLASWPDAVDPDRSLSAIGRYLVYLLAGIGLLRLPWSASGAHRLRWGLFAILAFWTLDGIYQFMTGVNLLGYPIFPGGRLTGMFENSPRLGLMLATLSPLWYETVRRLSARWPLAWSLLIPLVAIVLLGGSRASWMIFVVGAVLYVWYLTRLAGQVIDYKAWAWRGGILLVVAGVLIAQLDWLSSRVEVLGNLTSGEYAAIDAATSGRLPRWQAFAGMFAEHWFNGVGVRNYALVYLAQGGQSSANDIYGHPHLFFGEIAAETGLIGLLGYLAFLVLVMRRFLASPALVATPWLIAVLLASFPLSSTLSFYSLFWSTLLWLLVLAWLSVERQSAG
jgi:O-antigen ligase